MRIGRNEVGNGTKRAVKGNRRRRGVPGVVEEEELGIEGDGDGFKLGIDDIEKI